jgi:hypothetical protein
MHVLRRVGPILYVILLAMGAGLCVWGLIVTINEYGVEPVWQTVRRGGASIVTLVVTAAFAVAMVKRGFRPVAPPLFVVSFCAVAGSLEFALHGYMKNWAPATAVEATHNNQLALAIVVGTLLFATFAVWFSSSRQPRSKSSGLVGGSLLVAAVAVSAWIIFVMGHLGIQ